MIGFSQNSRLENLGNSALSPLIPPPHFRQRSSHLRTNHIFEVRFEIQDQVAVRHADADHNELGIFNGSPDNMDKYGLTKSGRESVARLIPSLQSWIDRANKPLVIVHSDFRRTCEMAEIITDGLATKPWKIEQRTELRERDPGKLEGFAYRKLLAKFGFSAKEEESGGNSRGKLKRAISLIHRSNVLAVPSEQLLGLESVRSVEDRITSLAREMHERQKIDPQIVLYISHEFSLGPLLNAFLGRAPGMFWTNRHIPRAKPFELSVLNAQKHYLNHSSITEHFELEAA